MLEGKIVPFKGKEKQKQQKNLQVFNLCFAQFQ